MQQRLQKCISAAGVASRRAAETMISAGRVTVNGQTAQLGAQADPETDVICIDGIRTQGGDYVDIGEPVAEGHVVPVVIKTLILSTATTEGSLSTTPLPLT